MSLPILNITAAPTTQTLIRYFHQTQSNWSAHVSQSTTLDIGTACYNPQLSAVFIANRMLDAALPPEITPAQAIQQADEHFASHGATSLQWVMNPSAPPPQTAPLVEELLARGFKKYTTDIMYLDKMPATIPAGTKDAIKIIPARASFKHIRALHEEAVTQKDKSQF